MVDKAFLRFLFFSLTVFVFYGCGDEPQMEEIMDDTNPEDTIVLSEELGIEEGEAKIFTMPTPLQTATALELMGVEYNNSLLLKHDMVKSKSDVELSLALGMYMVDMGYTTVYNHAQKSLDYAKDVQAIMEELPIAFYVNDAFRKRFKNNLNNRDSLSRILLEGYNNANQYITESENEGIGLLILTGAYIESFHLAINSRVNSVWEDEYANILIQQKQFMDNFLTLLAPYKKTNGEIAEVYQLLTDLNVAFDGVEVKFNDTTETFELNQPITFQKRVEMKSKVEEIRKAILKRVSS